MDDAERARQTQEYAERIVSLVEHPYYPLVHAHTAGETPIRTQDISARTGIPIAVAYRLVNKLTEAGLLVLGEPGHSSSGRRFETYSSNVERLLVVRAIQPDSTRVRVIVNFKDARPPIELENLVTLENARRQHPLQIKKPVSPSATDPPGIQL
ncbi:MAG: hypothetical protein HYT16_01600 [DPANN group archaeon]|nr:hypothetical protein [DPANN group archaeon]